MKFSEYYKKQWRLYLNKFWVCSFRNKVYNLILLLDVLAMYQHYKFDEEKFST